MGDLPDRPPSAVPEEASPSMLSQLLDITEEEALVVSAQVCESIIGMVGEGREDSPPVLSVLEVARRSETHPIVVAAVLKYNPEAKEIAALAESVCVSQIEAIYTAFALGKPSSMALEEDGSFSPKLNKEQLHAMRFILQHKARPSDDEVDELLKRALGARVSDKEAPLDGEGRMNYLKGFFNGRRKA